METKVVIDKEKEIIRAYEQGDELGRLEFELKDGVLVIYHTITNEGFEGRGVGRALVTEAVDYALKNNAAIKPLCSFARAYLKKHPELEAKVLPVESDEDSCSIR